MGAGFASGREGWQFFGVFGASHSSRQSPAQPVPEKSSHKGATAAEQYGEISDNKNKAEE